jgi:hypothetical protein
VRRPGSEEPHRRSGNFHSFLVLVVLTAVVKITEGVVVGFQILHGLQTNINKNSGEKIKFGPPPPGPLGAIFRFFKKKF